LIKREQLVSTKIYDRHGRLLFTFFKDENRSLIELKDIPKHTIDATIAIEDQDFYNHTGISIRGILRAIKRNTLDNKTQGGSTITQQLVKNALLSPEKTLIRKTKELILALGVELTFTKNQILQMYFNEVGYGGSAYGVEQASMFYFGKHAKNLKLSESALLAGLPAAPTTYSPFGANPELALIRQHEVLRRMVEEGHITSDQADKAKSEKLTFVRPKNNIIAPHFVMYIKDILVKRYGESMVNGGGLTVITSLDYNIQKLAEEALEEELEKISHLNAKNGSILITKPKTGEILAMVGSKDYFDVENDGQVNVSLRPRQPGSSIKPITYALAFEKGFTPSSTIDDTPITYRTPGSPPYSPINYDGKFHGKVSLRKALANSYNIPAVKLLSHLGVNNLIEKAKQLGITTWTNPERFGLSLTLGGGEVKLIDQAVAYSTFANNGHSIPISPILYISDYKKTAIFKYTCDGINISFISEKSAKQEKKCEENLNLKPEAAQQINSILSDNNARSSTFGLNSLLRIPNHQVAVKTGTTNKIRDNWTLGYTKDFFVGVWVGNNDNTPMSNVASGITGASPVFNTIMSQLLKNLPSHEFKIEDHLIKVSICPLTNTLTCLECPNTSFEYFSPGTEPKIACNKEMIENILNPTKESLPRDRILEGASTTQ
ncbi:transglycosylase domain-containing protein, partial [Patescibacteria group bacterium]